MAAQIKLVRSADFLADVSEVSLYDYEDGFSLVRDGWKRGIASIGDRSVSESMTLAIKATSHDDLADKVQSIDQKAHEIGWYNDEISERYSVWLRCQMADESYPYQALLLGLRGEIGDSLYGPPVSPGNFVKAYTLALERMPYWESANAESFTADRIDTLGGTHDYGADTGAIPGDVPARIAKWQIQTVSNPANPITEAWIGFRTDRFGDRSNFLPVWECEEGVDGTDTDEDVSDSGASGGLKDQCDFASDESMAKRVTIHVADVLGSNYDDQRGRFTVLLRAKVGSSTICRVRLLDGYSGTDNWRTQSRVVVSDTDWTLYQLGEVSIPPVRGKTLLTSLAFYALRIEAERVSGSNDLHLDCLVLIPVAEGGAHFSGAQIEQDYETYVYTHPDGSRDGETKDLYYPKTILAIEGGNLWLPTGEGTFVFAAQRATGGQVLTDTCTHTFQYFERWRTLRGAE